MYGLVLGGIFTQLNPDGIPGDIHAPTRRIYRNAEIPHVQRLAKSIKLKKNMKNIKLPASKNDAGNLGENKECKRRVLKE